MLDDPTRALLGFTARRMSLSLRGGLFALLLLPPWGAAILFRLLVYKGVQVPLGGVSLYGMLVLGYVLGFLVPLAGLFFGVGLAADEVEAGTLPYLFGRAVRREKLLLVRFAAMTAVLLAGVWAAVVGTYLLAVPEAGWGALAKESGVLFQDLGAVSAAVVVYGALFTLLGLLLKRPLFWGLVIGFGWENLVGWLPGFLKRFTLLFHLHTLMPHGGGPQGLVQNLMAAPESRLAASLYLVFYALVFLALACWRIRRMEAPASERGEG